MSVVASWAWAVLSFVAPPALTETRGDATPAGGTGEVALYVRADSDATTVVSPRLHFRKGLGPQGRTNIDLVYTADVWSSASIDVRTAATQRVVEQRDEINVGLDHERGVVQFGGGYRFSRENDYVSHALSVRGRIDTAQRNSTIEGRLFTNFDYVGRSGDEFFNEEVQGAGAWIGYTQLLSKAAWLQVATETRYANGYMASPYRYVSLGGGLCGTANVLCVPETTPTGRLRQAAVVRGRIAIAKRAAAGLGYRFYLDSWGVLAHTGQAAVHYTPLAAVAVQLQYRVYAQRAATFYRQQYQRAAANGFHTRDRELSRHSNHRVSAIAQWTKPVGSGVVALRLAGLVAGTHYRYPDFIGLDRVLALEVSSNLGVVF